MISWLLEGCIMHSCFLGQKETDQKQCLQLCHWLQMDSSCVVLSCCFPYGSFLFASHAKLASDSHEVQDYLVTSLHPCVDVTPTRYIGVVSTHRYLDCMLAEIRAAHPMYLLRFSYSIQTVHMEHPSVGRYAAILLLLYICRWKRLPGSSPRHGFSRTASRLS